MVASTEPTVVAPSVTPATARRRHVLLGVLAALLAVHVAIRAWVAFTGDFYWDDLILIGRAGTHPIYSWAFLGDNHDGHVMPAAFAVVGAVTSIAPLSWPAAAATLVVGQVIATAAVTRMVLVVAGLRMASLVALSFYLFTAMTIPSFAWWASGLNTLPLQAALAWVATDAVLLTRDTPTGSRRPSVRHIATRSSIVFAVALAFFEKSALILPVAFVAAVLVVRLAQLRIAPDEPTRALPVVWRRGRPLWAALTAVAAVWAVLFAVVARPAAGDHSVRQTVALVWRSITDGIVPSLAGGPWSWDRWVPSPPFGVPGTTIQVLGWLVLVGAVVAAVTMRRGAGAVVTCAIVYAVIAQALPSWNRSSSGTALELAQTLRYLPDAAVVITLAAALVVAAPARTRSARPSRIAPVGVAVVALIVLVGSVVSTATFVDRWRDDPTGAYVDAARTALAENAATPMFDQALPLEVLLPVAYPDNQISRVFAALRDRPVFGDWTDRLQVLSPRGKMTPGAVTRTRAFAAGTGACDRPEVAGPTTLRLDGPVIRWRWTAQIAYCATSGGDVEVRIGDSAPVTAPVQPGLHGLWVQATGTGDTVSIRPLTPGLALHLGAGTVGEVYDPALLG